MSTIGVLWSYKSKGKWLIFSDFDAQELESRFKNLEVFTTTSLEYCRSSGDEFKIDLAALKMESISQKNCIRIRRKVLKSEATNCNNCGKSFGFFRRKHNCRGCGHVVCGSCGSNQVSLSLDSQEKESEIERVCSKCVDGVRVEKCGGCGYKTYRRGMNYHIDFECKKKSSCPYNCGEQSIPDARLAKHKNECYNRPLRCPGGCGLEINKSLLLNHKEKECSKRIVDCRNGCNEKMEAGKMDKHATKDCKFRSVSCPEGCGVQVRVTEQNNHTRNSCSMRQKCSCGTFTLPSTKRTHDTNDCVQRIVSCSFGCGVRGIKFIDLQSHQSNCLHRQVACDIGCGKRMKAKDLNSHEAVCDHRTIYCREGCGSQIKYKDVSYHENNSCSKRTRCSLGCQKRFLPSQITDHQENDCIYRIVRCSSCGTRMKQNTLSSHQSDSCPNRKVLCPNGCNSRLSVGDLDDHTENKCTKRLLKCDYCSKNFQASSLQSHMNNCTSRPSKIEAAAITMILFLQNLMSARDRCSIAAFNDQYRPLINLGTENDAKIVMAVLTEYCKGGTHLWDSIIVSVVHFISIAERTRPWVLIILTDGDDQGSENTRTDAAQALQLFNRPQNNFCFVVGLGRSVNEGALRSLCDSSGSMYLPAENTAALHVLFALIGLQVSSGVQVDVARIMSEGVEQVYARVREVALVGRQPIDILLLVDVSGSMNEK